MDYNDNDYEGHNLHLTGEESSKISPVLRPFALPKFDFDDSLHGHLRFDSLVENEVFLGIPNQEDNQWIEEYSRGGNGIEFNPTAAESCALPRHVNVWSEATSSESVEMLLKAVGQEEMVKGENIVDSDPGNHLAGSTEQTENNLRQDDHQNSLLLPTEGQGDISRSNARLEGTEYALQIQDMTFASSEVCPDSKDTNLGITTKDSDSALKMISDKLGSTDNFANESVSGEVQGNSPLLGTDVNFTQSSSQSHVVNVMEFVDQDKIIAISSVNAREQEEGCTKNDMNLEGGAVTIGNHSCFKRPSKMEPSKEEHVVEFPFTMSEEVSDVPGKATSVAPDGFNEVAFVDAPSDSSQHEAAVLSIGTVTKDLHEASSIAHERSSVLIEGEGNEGVGINGSDDVNPIIDEAKLKRTVFQSLSQHNGLDGNQDSYVRMNNSLDAPSCTGNPSEQKGERNTNPTVDLGILADSTIDVKCWGEKSVVDDKDRDSSISQQVILEDVEHVHSPLTADNLQKSKESVSSMQVDAQKSDLGYDETGIEKKDKKLPLDSSYIHVEKEASLGFSGGGNTETTPVSQPNISTGDYPVLNAEGIDTKLTSSCIEGNAVIDGRDCSSTSCDEGCKDQSKETEIDVLKKPYTSVPVEVSKSAEIVHTGEIEKELDSAVDGARISGQCFSAVETSSVAMPRDACMELNKIGGLSATDVMVPDEGAEAAHAENSTEAEKEKNHATDSVLSVARCTVEIGRSNKAADTGTSCSDLSQSEINKEVFLERVNVKNSGKVLKESKTSAATVSSKEEGAFSFEIMPLGHQSTVDSSVGLQSFPRLQACKQAAVEGHSLSSGSSQINAVIFSESSHASSLTTGVSSPSGAPPERKPRRSNSKPGRGSAKKGNQVKETTPLRNTEKGGKASQVLSPLGSGQLRGFESALKPRGAVSIPSCSLPDLNASTPSSTFFQQPFTDLQQVQLRAQIFVYGSLIQGVAPDEPCMISAFGTSDGGRSIWEPSWRACVERLQTQKSQGNNSETPLPTRPGVKIAEQTNRQSFQSETFSSATSRAGIKAIQSPINSMIPLSSPLWSMATPSSEALPLSSMTKSSSFDYQAVSPLNPGQIPPVRNYVAHSSGPVQASFPVPWLPSSLSSPFDVSTSYPAFTIMEPLKLTPVKEISIPLTSSTKHTSPIPATLTAATTVSAVTPSLDLKKVKASTGQTADTKTRKRKKPSGADILQSPVTASLVDSQSALVEANQLSKKSPAVDGLNQISLIGHNQADLIPKPVVDSHYTTSVTVAAPSSLTSKGTTNQLFSVVPPSITTERFNRGGLNTDKMTLNATDRPNRGDYSINRMAHSVEDFSKVKEATLQAEEAAAHATAAVSHCEGLWSQLGQQKNSGMTSETDYKLASAASAIAAAASVAKAAAAAAKIASSAALEAKKMADEVITNSGTLNAIDYNAILASNVMKLANAPPLSILQGGNWNSASTLVISAAKEAARKRIESASAASRHAENLDAIVKAAELAAEAVSHAGKIVTMDDPFSLSELAVSGPSNYWKSLPLSATPGSKFVGLNKNKSSINGNAREVSDIYMSQPMTSETDTHITSHVAEGVLSKNIEPDHLSNEENIIASAKSGVISSKPQKDKKASDESKSTNIVCDPYTAPNIKEGSYVEVLKNRGELKAWFTATVLIMKDAEALVCYSELKSDQGSEPLKEWIHLEAKECNAPKIRIPHPMTTAVQFEGTKKRRRAAVKDYTWSVGDRVDAWVQDCWCEGIVAEKSTKDATTLSIHVPDIRETLPIKLWHLRPTLVWGDDQWTEWCRPVQGGTSQGDTPGEKRAKLVGTSTETKGKADTAKILDFGERGAGTNDKPELPLSANEKIFSVGSNMEQKNPTTVRSKKSASEKAPGVTIGIPNPKGGKRRKFMEVSKHYVSDGTSKATVPRDSMKLAKVLNPQGLGAWGTRNKSKLETKSKQVAESKTRAPKPGKPPGIPKSVPKKVGLTSSQSIEHEAMMLDQATVGSTSNDENESAGQNLTEFGSLSNVEETSEDTVRSSQYPPLESHKQGANRNTKSERLNQGKPASASEESAKDEANEALTSQVNEPRRSHRRIQPTSRLLEGLQSSMTIPKFPSTSHDKGPRSHKKRPNLRE